MKDVTTDPGEDRAREDNILALAESGNRMAAVGLVREYYGTSLGDPARFVDELMGRSAGAGAPSPKA